MTLSFLLAPINFLLGLIEGLLFALVRGYDAYVYSPIQMVCTPVVDVIPRSLVLGSTKVDVFTANIVSWSRTALIVPVAWCLKYGYYQTAFWCVVLHDFLDHLDGIVAKAHKRIYGPVDDPLLGGFMDAFCDKVVNCTCLWTIVWLTDYTHMTVSEIVIYQLACWSVIVYESIIGVVRVQDYFHAKYGAAEAGDETRNIASVMEGKLKEKLESMGIAFMCLAQSTASPFDSWVGYAAVICLLLCIRLAHASLAHKLAGRSGPAGKRPAATNDKPAARPNEEALDARPTVNNSSGSNGTVPTLPSPSPLQLSLAAVPADIIGTELFLDPDTLPPSPIVDKVFTVGCFDLFHAGHIALFKRLRKVGKQVIVGVHDSDSIRLLKNREPIDSTITRMTNVKQHVDQVYAICGTDPSAFIDCAVHLLPGEKALYIRGADMVNFPGRKIVENHMPVRFLPYTQGISSTMLRQQLMEQQQQAVAARRFSDSNKRKSTSWVDSAFIPMQRFC